MKITNLVNDKGNPAVNQFEIETGKERIFQSYDTKIAVVKDGQITLDNGALSYSKTTSKHLFIFLGMNRKQIEDRIKSGVIKLKNLNK